MRTLNSQAFSLSRDWLSSYTTTLPHTAPRKQKHALQRDVRPAEPPPYEDPPRRGEGTHKHVPQGAYRTKEKDRTRERGVSAQQQHTMHRHQLSLIYHCETPNSQAFSLSRDWLSYTTTLPHTASRKQKHALQRDVQAAEPPPYEDPPRRGEGTHEHVPQGACRAK